MVYYFYICDIYILCCICLHIYNIECIYTLFVHVQKHILYIHIQLPAENGLAGVSGVAMVFASPPFWTHQKLESQSRQTWKQVDVIESLLSVETINLNKFLTHQSELQNQIQKIVAIYTIRKQLETPRIYQFTSGGILVDKLVDFHDELL